MNDCEDSVFQKRPCYLNVLKFRDKAINLYFWQKKMRFYLTILSWMCLSYNLNAQEVITLDLLTLDTLQVSDVREMFEYPYEIADVHSGSRYFMEANQQYQKGQLNQAYNYMKAAIKKNPNKYEYHHLMAYILMDLDENKAAVSHAQKAVRLKPNDWKMLYVLAMTKYAARDFLGANMEYSKAIEIEPTEFLLYEGRAYAKAELGDALEAFKDFDLTIMLKPTYIKAYYGRGLMNHKLGNYQAAIVDFTSVLMREPDNGRVYYQRGLSRKQLGDVIYSCQDFEKAVQLGVTEASVEIKNNCNR